MKAGAVDFLEKPISKERLMSAIQHALDSNDKLPRSILKNDAVQERVNQLTPREREVFQLLVAGKTSKIIADDLCISQRTAEVHRANIMEKMGVSNIGELIVLALGGEWPK
jgi:FixJ family two-component response regulator